MLETVRSDDWTFNLFTSLMAGSARRLFPRIQWPSPSPSDPPEKRTKASAVIFLMVLSFSSNFFKCNLSRDGKEIQPSAGVSFQDVTVRLQSFVRSFSMQQFGGFARLKVWFLCVPITFSPTIHLFFLPGICRWELGVKLFDCCQVLHLFHLTMWREMRRSSLNEC